MNDKIIIFVKLIRGHELRNALRRSMQRIKYSAKWASLSMYGIPTLGISFPERLEASDIRDIQQMTGIQYLNIRVRPAGIYLASLFNEHPLHAGDPLAQGEDPGLLSGLFLL